MKLAGLARQVGLLVFKRSIAVRVVKNYIDEAMRVRWKLVMENGI